MRRPVCTQMAQSVLFPLLLDEVQTQEGGVGGDLGSQDVLALGERAKFRTVADPPAGSFRCLLHLSAAWEWLGRSYTVVKGCRKLASAHMRMNALAPRL